MNSSKNLRQMPNIKVTKEKSHFEKTDQNLQKALEKNMLRLTITENDIKPRMSHLLFIETGAHSAPTESNFSRRSS